MMLRLLKIAFMSLVALWAFFAVQGNLAQMGVTYAQVQHVVNMPMFKPGEGPPWANNNPVLIWLGVALIVGGKLTTLWCTGRGVYRMYRARHADSAVFQQSKQWALMGAGLTVVWLFFGFTIIGENVFYMFMDEVGKGAAQSAFRYGTFIALMMIFVAQPE